jgi:YqjK-like protein
VSARSIELALRHGALRERIAEQRRVLASHAGPLERVLGNADKALAGVEWVKTHPQVVGLAVAVVVVASPKRAWRWSKRFYFVWRGWQSLRNSLLATRSS